MRNYIAKHSKRCDISILCTPFFEAEQSEESLGICIYLIFLNNSLYKENECCVIKKYWVVLVNTAQKSWIEV
jgi:hypothetical protein